MFELRVLNGQQQGAALPLIGEQWSIGSADQQDLSLDDPGVKNLHCRLQRLDDNWSLNAEQGTVLDEEGNATSRVELTPNSAFLLGSVWLCVSPAEDDWPAVPAIIAQPPEADAEPAYSTPPLEKVETRSQFLNRTTGIIAGLLIGILGSAWSLTRPASTEPEQSATHAEPVAPAAAKPSQTSSDYLAPTAKRQRLANAGAVRHTLGRMLSDRLLTDVSIEETPQGLVLNGNLKDEALLVYQRMLQRFKDSYESPVTVLDNVDSVHNGLPFVIVQIMTGPHAHLVTADGRRLYVGDEVQGLRLTRIDDQHLQFDGDRHIEVNW